MIGEFLMIGVINYGIGNVGSIVNMFNKIGVPVFLLDKVEDFHKADKLILPGVGSFDSGMKKLKDSGMDEVIKYHTLHEKKPLLGICLGMQMLGRRSEEGQVEGLSLIPFENKKFSFDGNQALKIPHMGWNIANMIQKEDPLLTGINNELQRYYFVHSYHAICDSKENELITCDYGYSFTAAVKKGDIYGVQFHPEKSHKFGMALLENFAKKV